MAVSVVQSVGAPATTAATASVTFTSTPAIGNLLVFSACTHNAPVITDPAGTTRINAFTGNTNQIALSYRRVQSGDGKTWAASVPAGSTYLSLIGVEVSGADPASPIGNTPTGVNTAATPATAPPATPPLTGSLALACVTTDSGEASYTVSGAGWSLLATALGTAAYHSQAIAVQAGLTGGTATSSATVAYGTGSTALATTLVINPSRPLTTPTGLTATVISGTEIDLSWNAVTGAAGYDLQRDGVLIATGVAGLTYADTGLAAGHTYTYNVRSIY